jgi:beta-phosphoglucomutase-like phosphatase (HAD superfamily)
MSSLIVFDLDGVLIDSKEVHFNALNLALGEIDPKFVISRNEQDDIFEGLTTNAKLNILTEMKGLPPALHKQIWERKQHYSSRLFTSVSEDRELVSLFKYIRSTGIKIAIASNSIRATLDSCLVSLGLWYFIDFSLSNEDVSAPKPSPEIYLKCMEYFGSSTARTAIFEDSEIGLRAAYSSGAKLIIEVQNRGSLTFEKIMEVVEHLNEA